MAVDFANQPLLLGLLDPPDQPKKRSSVKKKRYLRSKSDPSVHTSCEATIGGGLLPASKFIFSNFRPSFRQVVIFSVIYVVAASVCFYLVRHQIKGQTTDAILDALYFCVVTMTTVGYGDLLPDSAMTKLLACFFVFSGMAVVALFLSKAADYFVEKQEVLLVRTLHLRHKAGEAQIMKEVETNRVKYKFLMTTMCLLVLILIGTIFLVKIENLDLVDAFYCVCSTITTLGYGDKSFSTKGGRVFAVFWILTSTICVAQFFFYLAELNTEHRQHKLAHWALTRTTTCRDLEAADLDGDGVIDAAEFIIYKLKEMGKISQEDVALVMEEFENLDVDKSGTLSNHDLVLAQSTWQ